MLNFKKNISKLYLFLLLDFLIFLLVVTYISALLFVFCNFFSIPSPLLVIVFRFFGQILIGLCVVSRFLVILLLFRY